MKARINIPDNLSEITLEQYQRFVSIEEPTEQDVVSIFCNLPITEVNKIKRKSVAEINEHITQLLESEPPLKKRFTLRNKDYGFIPNLEEMSFGEYTSIDTFFSDWQQMHKAIAILYRPIKTKAKGMYTIEDYKDDGSSELMKYIGLDVVLGATVFFYRLGEELLNVTQKYLKEKAMEELEKNGDGTDQYTTSLKKIFNNSTMLPN